MKLHGQQNKTVREAFIQASSFLTSNDVMYSEDQVKKLLMYVTGWDYTKLLMNWQDPFVVDAEKWNLLLHRRAAGEPLQYIIGEEYFYGRRFTVNSSVLIPRPETELLVERIMQISEEICPQQERESWTVADIGTGSGAIAVTLAAEFPNWQVYASDVSVQALQVAKENAMNAKTSNLRFLHGDLLTPLSGQSIWPNVIVSNPPYIHSAEMPTLQREVREFEPALALDGGADGLQLYRKMIAQMYEYKLTPQLVGFEVGMGQARILRSMLTEMKRWSEFEIVKDLAGIERHVLAWNLS